MYVHVELSDCLWCYCVYGNKGIFHPVQECGLFLLVFVWKLLWLIKLSQDLFVGSIH